MRKMRVAFVVWALFGAILGLHCIRAPLVAFDEPLWYHRGRHWPTELKHPLWRFAAIDVPGANRWVYGVAFRLAGIDGLKCRWPNYANSHAQNLKDGCVAPWRAVMVMRFVNVAALLAAFAALYLAARLVLKSSWWAVVAALPLALSANWSGTLAARVGPDALLACALAATLAAWLAWHMCGQATRPRYVLYLGLLAGLATGTKLNGGLVVLALGGYLVVGCRGWRRLTMPLLMVGGALIMFTLLNPVVFMGGCPPWRIFLQMVERRLQQIGGFNARLGPVGFMRFAQAALPIWPLLPVLAIVFAACRKAPWFPPVAWWGGMLALGTFFGINQAFPRYVAPLELAIYFPASLSIIWLCTRRRAVTPPNAPTPETPLATRD